MAHDRRAELRHDQEWLERAWAAPRTRVVAVAGTRLRTRDGAVAWDTPQDAPEGLRVLLGLDEDERATFAVFGARELADDEGWAGLRQVAAAVSAEDLAYLMHAVGLAEWHAATRHCPRCGTRLEPTQAGHVLHCPGCGRDQFPRTDPAVIMIVTDAEDRALLGRQPSWPAGRWSTLAGFVEPGESLEDAVRREVREETGVLVGDVEYVGSQPWPMPASLMLGFRARATSTEVAVDGTEIEEARWFSRAEARSAAEDGTLVIPPGISISRSLITGWYGDELPGSWT